MVVSNAPVGFVGGVHDQDDLVYLKHRYYNPIVGRFYQPDPVTFANSGKLGQIHRYQYSRNDPFAYKDPDGKAAWFAVVPLAIWALDNLKSDTPNPNNEPPSGIGDMALMAYGTSGLLAEAKFSTMTGAQSSYYQMTQKAVPIATVVSTSQSVNWTTVGRWMSVAEYNAMKLSPTVLEGGGGVTFVTVGGSKVFPSAAKGSVYAEFQVPTNSLVKGGVEGWYKTIGPSALNSQKRMVEKQGGQISPLYKNLTPILERK